MDDMNTQYTDKVIRVLATTNHNLIGVDLHIVLRKLVTRLINSAFTLKGTHIHLAHKFLGY